VAGARQAVGFLTVAAPVRQDKVVAQVHWVAGPRDEVIDMGRLLPERPALLAVLGKSKSSRL
jgi:hypothetical protein